MKFKTWLLISENVLVSIALLVKTVNSWVRSSCGMVSARNVADVIAAVGNMSIGTASNDKAVRLEKVEMTPGK